MKRIGFTSVKILQDLFFVCKLLSEIKFHTICLSEKIEYLCTSLDISLLFLSNMKSCGTELFLDGVSSVRKSVLFWKKYIY